MKPNCYKVVRIVNGFKKSASVYFSSVEVVYGVGVESFGHKTKRGYSPLFAFSRLESAKSFATGNDEIYEAIGRYPQHPVFMLEATDEQLDNLETVLEFWEDVSIKHPQDWNDLKGYALDRPPTNTVFFRSIQLVKKIDIE